MQCPKCHENINIGKQVKQADMDWYQGIEPPILLMIMCDNCEEPTVAISIDGVAGFDEVVSPALGGEKVKVPRIKHANSKNKKTS